MCNTRYPIFNIGEVGVKLTEGQMRGMRCHIICKFNDTKLTDLLSMDDSVGVTTVKDIYEDDRMDKSLIEILEEISKDNSSMYEALISAQKDKFNENITNIEKELQDMKKMADDILLDNKYDLNKVYEDLNNYILYQAYYFDSNKLEFKYCKSKEETKKKVKSGEGTKCTKNNAIYKNILHTIIPLITQLQKKKKALAVKEEELQEIMKKYNLVREEAKIKYVELLQKKNADIAEEKRKKHLENLLNNAKSFHQAKEYGQAVNLYKTYIETKDGECNEINELIEKITEEQVCNLRKELKIELENKNYNRAIDYTEELIDVDENLFEEMDKLQDEINNLKIKAKEGHAEEKIKDNKYGEALKLYESILSECTLTKNEMCTINDKMKEIEGLKVKSYVEKVDEYISVNDFKKAKKYSGYICKIDPEEGDKINKRIEENEGLHETRMKSITIKDIDNIYQVIMRNCTTDKDIQKFYKVLEYYHNNP